jgi:hypothetical protein
VALRGEPEHHHNSAAQGGDMEWGFLIFMFFVLGALFANLLMRMSSEADRKARHAQRRIDPYCDVTITRLHWR